MRVKRREEKNLPALVKLNLNTSTRPLCHKYIMLVTRAANTRGNQPPLGTFRSVALLRDRKIKKIIRKKNKEKHNKKKQRL